MGRRLVVVLLLALVGAASAQARVETDPLYPQEWWLSHIGADRATPPGPGIPIAIIDSGVDVTHAEFAGRPNTTLLNDQTTFGGKEWHGTAVASAAAAPENGVGIVGVYPNAQLDVYDASPTPQGIDNATAAAGIMLAAQHCPAVISLSFGSTDPSEPIDDAVTTATHNGCLVFAASGNVGQTAPPVYPASIPHVVMIGATDASDNVAPFSIAAPGMGLVAPGDNITVAVPSWSTASGYRVESGTSFSTPIAAAAAAWVWTMRPSLTNMQLAQLLRNSARDIGLPGYDTSSGYGLIDIPAALTAATPQNDPSEPNDDIDEVKPGELFSLGEPPLTSAAHAANRIAGTLDQNGDPRDLYRIWVPPRRYVRVSTVSAGDAAARIWGPKTVGVGEGLAARRRDLKGQKMYGGKTGSQAYVEVLLTGRSNSARYVLSVTASKR